MKVLRKWGIMMGLFALLMLVGGNSNARNSISEEKRIFAKDEAVQLIEKMEAPLVKLSEKAKVSRAELELLNSDLKKVYGEYASQLINVFFVQSDLDNQELILLPIDQRKFYPSIFHKDIEISQAYILKVKYPKTNLSGEFLYINERYEGTDPKLIEFKREYVFKKDNEGNWKVITFSGIRNYSRDGIYNKYLQLKKDNIN